MAAVGELRERLAKLTNERTQLSATLMAWYIYIYIYIYECDLCDLSVVMNKHL